MMKEKTPDEIIASRRCKFLDYDNGYDEEYIEVIQEISLRVRCPQCGARKGVHCYITQNNEPAHRCRLMLLHFRDKKTYDNLRYVMRDRRWKGNNAVVKIEGDWFVVGVVKYAKGFDSKWKQLVIETYGNECLQ